MISRYALNIAKQNYYVILKLNHPYTHHDNFSYFFYSQGFEMIITIEIILETIIDHHIIINHISGIINVFKFRYCFAQYFLFTYSL